MDDRAACSSISSEEGDERTGLMASPAGHTGYLSDDGTTPLIKGPSRRQQVAYWARTTLRFMLSNWYKFVVLGFIITLIVLVSVKGFSIFGVVLRWFQARNNWAGWGIFVGMYCAVVALFLPGVAFIMGAGFVFGFWKGLLAVWIGGAVGQALAFLLARYLLKEWVEASVRARWKKWDYIDKAIELDGWKLVLIMRFSPIIPYNLLNIAMATTSMPFWQFTIVSAVGIVWECAVFCYFGSMAENVTSIAAGDGVSGPFEWVMLGVSVVMCVVGAIFVSVSVKKAIKRAEVHMSSPSLTCIAAAAMSDTDDSPTAPPGLGLGARGPISLEREGFLSASGIGGSSLAGGKAYAPRASPPGSSRAQFELKPVFGGGAVGVAASAASGTAAAAAAHLAPAPGSGRKLKVSGADPAECNDGSGCSPGSFGGGSGGGGGVARMAAGAGVALRRGEADLELGHSTPRRRQSGSIGGEQEM